MDFGGGHGFIYTSKQCSTVEADLWSGSVLRTHLTQLGALGFSSAQLQPGSGVHEEVAHATGTPRDHWFHLAGAQFELPEASLQDKSLQVVSG